MPNILKKIISKNIEFSLAGNTFRLALKNIPANLTKLIFTVPIFAANAVVRSVNAFEYHFETSSSPSKHYTLSGKNEWGASQKYQKQIEDNLCNLRPSNLGSTAKAIKKLCDYMESYGQDGFFDYNIDLTGDDDNDPDILCFLNYAKTTCDESIAYQQQGNLYLYGGLISLALVVYGLKLINDCCNKESRQPQANALEMAQAFLPANQELNQAPSISHLIAELSDDSDSDDDDVIIEFPNVQAQSIEPVKHCSPSRGA